MNKTFSYFSIYIRELKFNLILYILIFFLLFGISYNYHNQILVLFTRPITNDQNIDHFILTSITEAFTIKILLSIVVSFIISLPLIIFHFWFFLSNGLYKNENIFILKVFITFLINYIFGFILLYKYLIPNIGVFFLSFQEIQSNVNTVLEPRLNTYINLIINLIFYIPFLIQIPLFLIFNPFFNFLINIRKLIYILILIIATIITPPDIISQIILSVPLWITFELSIFIKILFNKYRNF